MRTERVGDFLATLAVIEQGGSSVRSASFPVDVQNDDDEVDEPGGGNDAEPRTDPRFERLYRLTALLPRLGFYEGHVRDTPIDFHHILSLVAPRPFFNSAALDDAILDANEILYVDETQSEIRIGFRGLPSQGNGGFAVLFVKKTAEN